MIVLSYLWIFALIPLLVEKDDREVQWHAKHGLVLTGAEFLLWVVLSIFSTIVGTVLGCLLPIVFFLVWIGILAFHIFLMVKGVNGERVTVPYVSEYADKF